MTTLEAQFKSQRDFAIQLAQRWRASFDRCNEQCDELLEAVADWQRLHAKACQQFQEVSQQCDRLFALLDRAHQREDELIALIEEMEPEE